MNTSEIVDLRLALRCRLCRLVQVVEVLQGMRDVCIAPPRGDVKTAVQAGAPHAATSSLNEHAEDMCVADVPDLSSIHPNTLTSRETGRRHMNYTPRPLPPRGL